MHCLAARGSAQQQRSQQCRLMCVRYEPHCSWLRGEMAAAAAMGAERDEGRRDAVSDPIIADAVAHSRTAVRHV